MSQGLKVREDVANGELPEGWRWVKLGEVIQLEYGKPLEQAERISDGEFPIYGANGEKDRTSRCYYDKPSIIVGRKGSAGEINLTEEKFWPLDVTYFVKHDENKTDLQFIYFTLKTLNLPSLAKGVKPGINRNEVYALSIPLPPLPEQQRIAAILNEKMTAVEQTRQAADEQVKAAKKLFAAYLRKEFTVENVNAWPIAKLREVADIGSGITLGRKVNGSSCRSVPYLRVANVKDGHLDLSSVYQIDVTEEEIKRCRLQFGDILLTEGGDPDKLGRGSYWNDELPECIHQNHIFRIRFDLAKFDPLFIAAQFGSEYGKRYFLAHAKQTTGIATINQKVLGDFPLQVPSFSTQKRIAANLEGLKRDIDQICEAINIQAKDIELLPSVLLRQTFRGEL